MTIVMNRIASILTARARRIRKVVYSNFLRYESLRAYLSKSPDNHAVLTDFVAMEV